MVSAVASRHLGTHCAKARMHVRCRSANVRPCKGSIAATAGSHAVSAITAHRTTPAPAESIAAPVGELTGPARRVSSCEINWRADHDHFHRPRHPNGDHVRGGPVFWTDPGIEALRD